MEWTELLNRRLELTKKVLTAKEEEYSEGKDRYHNFRIAGRIDDESPEKALWGMFKKHLVSIMDMINWVDERPEKLTHELVDEKIGDAINYFILLEGVLKQTIDNQEKEEK